MPLPSYFFPLAVTSPTTVGTGGEATEDGSSFPFATYASVEATGDLEFPLRIVRGVEAFRLRLLARLRFFKKEWFLDTRQGVPYFEVVYVKNPDISLVQAIFRRAILSTPGAQSIAKMSTTFDQSVRSFTINPLEIIVTGGKIFRAQPDEFIIPLLRPNTPE